MTEHHRQRTFSQAQGVETLLAEPGKTEPPSAETSCLGVATKAEDTQGMLELCSQAWMEHPVSKGRVKRQTYYSYDKQLFFDSA